MNKEDLKVKHSSILRMQQMFKKGHYDKNHLSEADVKAKLQTFKVELKMLEEAMK